MMGRVAWALALNLQSLLASPKFCYVNLAELNIYTATSTTTTTTTIVIIISEPHAGV